MKFFTVLFLIVIAVALVNGQRGFGRRGPGGRSVGGPRRSGGPPRSGGRLPIGRSQFPGARLGPGRGQGARPCQPRPQPRPTTASPIASPTTAAPTTSAPTTTA